MECHTLRNTHEGLDTHAAAAAARRPGGGPSVPCSGTGHERSAPRSSAVKKRSDCRTGQGCVHHVCVAKCGDPFTCVNEVPDGGTGCAGADCFCAKTPAGRGVCLQTGGTCAFNADGCTKQRQCQDGEICASGCCGAGIPHVPLPGAVRRVACLRQRGSMRRGAVVMVGR